MPATLRSSRSIGASGKCAMVEDCDDVTVFEDSFVCAVINACGSHAHLLSMGFFGCSEMPRSK